MRQPALQPLWAVEKFIDIYQSRACTATAPSGLLLGNTWHAFSHAGAANSLLEQLATWHNSGKQQGTQPHRAHLHAHLHSCWCIIYTGKLSSQKGSSNQLATGKWAKWAF